MDFRNNLTLNERYPDNPYRGMNLCDKCYREVYENAPALLVKNSFDDKSVVTSENTEGSGMAFRGIVCLVFVVAFLVSIAGIASLPSTVWNFVGFGQQLAIVFALLVGFCVVLLSYWVWKDGSELKSLRETGSLLKQEVDELNSRRQVSNPKKPTTE